MLESWRPEDIKRCSKSELNVLCDELRNIIDQICQTHHKFYWLMKKVRMFLVGNQYGHGKKRVWI